MLTQRQLIKSELLTRHLGTSARFSHLGQIRVDTSSAPEVTFFSMFSEESNDGRDRNWC